MGDIELKVNEIVSRADKERTDKISLYMDVESNLLSFVQTQMKRIENGNDLKNAAIQTLLTRVTENPESMDDVVLLKIVEIMERTDTDKTNNILNVFSEIVKSSNIAEAIRTQNQQLQNNGSEPKETVSKADIDKAKKVLNVIDRISRLSKTEL